MNEQKSKPTQQSVSMLMQRGIIPDMILCRSTDYVSENIKEKISIFCNIDKTAVISAIDVDDVYKIPLIFESQDVLNVINKKLGLNAKPDLVEWKKLVEKKELTNKLRVAICGKYTALEDSYASVVEALNHAAKHNDVSVEIVWIDTESVETGCVVEALKNIQGVIVPGGFGSRGVEGKIKVIKYCRENKIPYLGLCYGLQLAVIDFARNVCGLEGAHTTEIDKETKSPVIDILPDKKDVKNLGGTLRLGAYDAILLKGSMVSDLYSAGVVSERHRHRYEVNPSYHDLLIDNGLKISGYSPDGRLAEFIELEDHPFFVATQAHPELKSSLLRPAPLFMGLVTAIIETERK